MEIMEDKKGAKTSSRMEESKGNSQEQPTGAKNPSGIVNLNLLETRVDDSQQLNT